jgi:hypothetical protein
VLYSGKFLALPTNTKLRWRGLEVTNALAYYDTATITAVKSFIVLMNVSVFITVSHFHPSIIFVNNSGASCVAPR